MMTQQTNLHKRRRIEKLPLQRLLPRKREKNRLEELPMRLRQQSKKGKKKLD